MTLKFKKRDIEFDTVFVNEIEFQIKNFFDICIKKLVFWLSESPSPTKFQNLTNSFTSGLGLLGSWVVVPLDVVGELPVTSVVGLMGSWVVVNSSGHKSQVTGHLSCTSDLLHFFLFFVQKFPASSSQTWNLKAA